MSPLPSASFTSMVSFSEASASSTTSYKPLFFPNPTSISSLAITTKLSNQLLAATDTNATQPLFLAAPTAIYLSNDNFTCPDTSAINLGGGVPPYTLLLLNATAALLSGTNVTTSTFGNFIVKKMDNLAVGVSSIGVAGSLGEQLQFGVLDSISTLALSPIVNVTEGMSGPCSPHASHYDITKDKTTFAIVIVFSILAFAVLSMMFWFNPCWICSCIGGYGECCAECCDDCCCGGGCYECVREDICCQSPAVSYRDPAPVPFNSGAVAYDYTRRTMAAEEGGVHSLPAAPTRKAGVERAPDF